MTYVKMAKATKLWESCGTAPIGTVYVALDSKGYHHYLVNERNYLGPGDGSYWGDGHFERWISKFKSMWEIVSPDPPNPNLQVDEGL